MELCSTLAQSVGEPLAGSAPFASVWVLLEQPGPWGQKALTQSHLDPKLGRGLYDWANGSPLRLGTIRRPGRHADEHRAIVERSLLIARTEPTGSWLWHAQITDPRCILDIDPAVLLAATDPPAAFLPAGELVDHALLVCTNAKRDRCCALLGRPLVDAFSTSMPGRVWETSHLGGHRFAPTLVSLPDGYLFGGPNAGDLTVAACRGRSSLPAAGQAAELAALTHWGVEHPTALDVVARSSSEFQVSSLGEFRPGTPPVTVTIERVPAEQQRPESCGREPAEWQRLTAHVLP